MNKAQAIKQQINVEKVLDYYSIDYKYNGRMIYSRCPIHDGDNPNAMVFDPDEKLYFCFTDCRSGGDVIRFVEQMEDLPFVKALDKLAEICDINTEGMVFERSDFGFDDIKKFMRRKKVPDLPKFEVENYDFKRIKNYRGISDEAMAHFKIMYCRSGDGLEGRVITPLYDIEGKLVGMTGRRAIEGSNAPKFFHMPRGLEMGSILSFAYNNKQDIQEKDELLLVEGIFDVAKLWDCGIKNAASPVGVFFTDVQMKLAAQLTTKIVFAFDGDDVGRKGMKKAIEKCKYMFDVYVIVLPEGKDWGDLKKEEVEYYYNKQIHYTKWEGILA